MFVRVSVRYGWRSEVISHFDCFPDVLRKVFVVFSFTIKTINKLLLLPVREEMGGTSFIVLFVDFRSEAFGLGCFEHPLPHTQS